MVLQFIFAFLTCGIICLIAQVILDNTKLTTGHVTSLFVVLGSILEFFGVYKYIREFGGAGASMPICSFGSVIMEGVKKNVETQGFIGIFSGVFDSCGALIAFALFLAFVSTLLFKPKS